MMEQWILKKLLRPRETQTQHMHNKKTRFHSEYLTAYNRGRDGDGDGNGDGDMEMEIEIWRYGDMEMAMVMVTG